MAVAITRYVDPAATGTGDGTSWTNAYTSLAAAITDINADIPNFTNYDANADGVADGAAVTVMCRGNVGLATINCVGTTKDNFIKIKGEKSPSGVWDSTLPRITGNSSSVSLRIDTPAAIIEDMQISSTYSGTSDHMTVRWLSGTYLVLERCLLRNSTGKTAAGGTTNNGVYTRDNTVTGKTLRMVNCIVHGLYNRAIRVRGHDNDNMLFYNCTFVVGSDATYTGEMYLNATVIYRMKNCISVGPGWYNPGGSDNVTSQNNTNSGGTAPPGGATTGTPTFVDSANGNYLLASTDTVAREKGTDLSADAAWPVDRDIRNYVRPAATYYDIGAAEEGASPPATGGFTGGVATLGALAVSAVVGGFALDRGGFMENNATEDGRPVSYSIVTSVANGTIETYVGGAFDYTPALDFVGEDSFTYYVYTEGQQSNLGTVTILVQDLFSGRASQSILSVFGVSGASFADDLSFNDFAAQGLLHLHGGKPSLDRGVIGSGQSPIGVSGVAGASYQLGWSPTALQGGIDFIDVSETRMIAEIGHLSMGGDYPVLDINANGGIVNGPGPSDGGDQLDAQPVTVHLWRERETTVKLRR